MYLKCFQRCNITQVSQSPKLEVFGGQVISRLFVARWIVTAQYFFKEASQPCSSETFFTTLQQWNILHSRAAVKHSSQHCSSETFFTTLQQWNFLHNTAAVKLSSQPCSSETFFTAVQQWNILHNTAAVKHSSQHCSSETFFTAMKNGATRKMAEWRSAPRDKHQGLERPPEAAQHHRRHEGGDEGQTKDPQKQVCGLIEVYGMKTGSTQL